MAALWELTEIIPEYPDNWPDGMLLYLVDEILHDPALTGATWAPCRRRLPDPPFQWAMPGYNAALESSKEEFPKLSKPSVN